MWFWNWMVPCVREADAVSGDSHPARRVLLRGDGGEKIGAGHLFRLGAIGRGLARRGATSVLAGQGISTSPQDGFATSRREMAGIARPGWSEDFDADETLALVGDDSVTAVVVDHYRLGEAWERRLKGALPAATIVAVDDLPGRQHASDVLVDPNLGTGGPRLTAPGAGRLLRGVAYAPLGEDYVPASVNDVGAGRRPNILVSLGGGSHPLVRRLAGAFATDRRSKDADVLLVVPDEFEAQSIRKIIADVPSVQVSGPVPSLRPFIERADIVLGAGGTSAWQRLRLGRPAVIIALADNQVRTCKELDGLGLAIWVQDLNDPRTIVDAVFAALDDRSLTLRVREHGPLLVDGLGAARIAFAITPMCGLPALRRADHRDGSALLAMANDPETRSASRNARGVRPEEHLAWLEGALEGGQAPFWVAVSDGLVVGQVRFADLGRAWELGYGLDPIARGLGWSAPLVAEGVRRVRAFRDDPIVAVVGELNVVSHRALQSLGFRPDPEGQRSRAFGAQVGAGFSAYLLEPDRPTPDV